MQQTHLNCPFTLAPAAETNISEVIEEDQPLDGDDGTSTSRWLVDVPSRDPSPRTTPYGKNGWRMALGSGRGLSPVEPKVSESPLWAYHAPVDGRKTANSVVPSPL